MAMNYYMQNNPRPGTVFKKLWQTIAWATTCGMLYANLQMKAKDDAEAQHACHVAGQYLHLAVNLNDPHAKDRVIERVSVFDVDGPCLVATPYDAEMERLPRPKIRSMRTAWIVEGIEGPLEEQKWTGSKTVGDGEERAKYTAHIRVLHKVCGMWEKQRRR